MARRALSMVKPWPRKQGLQRRSEGASYIVSPRKLAGSGGQRLAASRQKENGPSLHPRSGRFIGGSGATHRKDKLCRFVVGFSRPLSQ